MNKHRREEDEMKMMGRKDGGSIKKMMHRKDGGSMDTTGRDVGLVGEKIRNTSSYDHPGWKSVERMLTDKCPITHLGTIAACDGGSMKAKHFAAGGVGKERKGMY